MGKIIAFSNQKGGVGKTTTAINLAAYVALAGKSVLIADIDPQGNATTGFGFSKSSLKKSVYNVLIDDAPAAGSNNPVKSSGIKTALDAKANDAELAPIAKSGKLSDATEDATHRTVTDEEKATWNAAAGIEGQIPTKTSDLTNDGENGTDKFATESYVNQ